MQLVTNHHAHATALQGNCALLLLQRTCQNTYACKDRAAPNRPPKGPPTHPLSNQHTAHVAVSHCTGSRELSTEAQASRLSSDSPIPAAAAAARSRANAHQLTRAPASVAPVHHTLHSAAHREPSQHLSPPQRLNHNKPKTRPSKQLPPLNTHHNSVTKASSPNLQHPQQLVALTVP